MSKIVQNVRERQGAALLLATVFVAIAILVLTSLSMRVMQEHNQVGHYEAYRNTILGVHSAVSESKRNIEMGGNGWIGLEEDEIELDQYGVPVPPFEAAATTLPHLETLPDIEYLAMAQNWMNDGLDNNGDSVIDGIEEWGYYTIYPFARHGDEVVRGAEVVVSTANVNVWNNAIFAGSGSVMGASIRGNVTIHGSVHILGNHLPPDSGVVVMDMGGTGEIMNNYTLQGGQPLSDRMYDSVPPLPKTIVNGELVDTINAEVRVKRGIVSLSGNSSIGKPNVDGDGVKDLMDGVYVQEGYTGNSTIDDGDRGDPTMVFSDNGFDEPYDLGNKVELPEMEDDWRWPAHVNCYEVGYDPSGIIEPGGTVVSPDGDNYEHLEYFADVLSDGDPYDGDVYISIGDKKNKTDVYINLSRDDPNPAHRVKDDPASCTKGDDYIYFDADKNVLEINGQVDIDGNLRIEGASGNNASNAIYYTGRGVINVRGDALLDSDLMSCNDGDPDDYVRSFPERNCFALMCSGHMTLGVKAQCNLLGAFYAYGTVTSNKQTTVMGTFVSNYFDMGQQVPDIYQVPALVNSLPLGMIGNWPNLVMSEVSWRELEVYAEDESS